jgi:hypothetical protein
MLKEERPVLRRVNEAVLDVLREDGPGTLLNSTSFGAFFGASSQP